jgi:hypothetical protein
MSMRVTRGKSWPDARRPGVRHWASVSYYLHWWELGLGGLIIAPFWLIGWMIVIELWIAAEALVLIASVVLVLLNLALGKHLDWRFMHWQRLGLGLWSVLVPERGEL